MFQIQHQIHTRVQYHQFIVTKLMLPGDEKHIGKELDKLYKIHNCSSITGKGGMVD